MHCKNNFFVSILFVLSINFIFKTNSIAHADSGNLLRPSIYFLPVFNLDKQSCSSSNYRSLISTQGKLIARVCSKIYDSCLMEGTCLLTNNQKESTTINYSGQVKGVRQFKILPRDGCRWGIGPTGACLDPFHTVAADLRYHKVGEVIFVPKLRDLLLPNGRKHTGYLIVRDIGGAIKGPHRFDFFTGIHGAFDPANPFSKVGLADTQHRLEYRVVGGDLAKEVRDVRKYPTLPATPD